MLFEFYSCLNVEIFIECRLIAMMAKDS